MDNSSHLANGSGHGPVSFRELRGDNFDVNSWLKEVLPNNDDGSNQTELDKTLTDVSKGLDEQINKTTTLLNALCQQVVVQVPRVAREFEVTHKEINKLQEEITQGFNEAENVQKKTTASMSTLERLDNIKTNLLATSSALQEADKWTSLGGEVDQFLESGDVFKSYECIIGMEKSLSVLDQSVSEERKLILEEVKNRLEALATKHLIQAFETSDIGNASKFFTMFSKLERGSQYIKYFESSEKIKLSQEWRNYVELLSFKDAVSKFYDDIIDHLHAKMQWCKVVFSSTSDEYTLNVLVGLYTEAIKTLEPSLQYCFEVEAKKQPFLDLLLQFNQMSHRFVQNIRQFIDGSCTVQPSNGKVTELLKVVFAPFIPQYPKYSKHHENFIVGKIQEAVKSLLSVGSISGEGGIVIQDRIDLAKRLLPEIILSVKESEEKVHTFNRGFGYYHFGRGINGGVEKFRDWCFEIYKSLESSIRHPEMQRNALENSLAFGEACGEILKQVVQLDNSITSNCTKLLSKIIQPNQSCEWEAFSEVYANENVLQEITRFQQSKASLLSSGIKQWKLLCKDASKLVLKVATEPIDAQLHKNFTVNDCNLKEAIPSEYITQIGEHLMLLPQNLDPYISAETSALTYAFFDQGGNAEESKSPIDYILANASVTICESYAERLLKLTHLSNGQAKQLAQDIDYLNSVLEDLGGKLTPDLLEFSKLMKAFPTIMDSTTSVEGASTRTLILVKRMKNATITS